MWALPATDVHAADRVTPVLGPKEPERVAALRGLFAVGGPLVVSATVRLDASELEAMRVLANAYMQRTRHASDMAWEDPE